MARRESKRSRDQVVVYVDARDRALLQKMTKKTGLPKTELFRRGLRRLADETLTENRARSSLRYLIATATDDEFPADVAERADEYLHGGGYDERVKRKCARAR